jgi:hypothetical protein
VLLGEDAETVLAGLVEAMSAEDTVEVVLCADGDALGLPVELIRLRTAAGGEVGPLGLLPAVALCRRPQPWRVQADAPPPRPPGRAGLAGPLKVLATVAAPEETKTANPPLDAEAEMAAVLDAVAGITAAGQVRILEVASLAAIRARWRPMPTMCCTCRRTGRRRRWSWRMRTGPRSACGWASWCGLCSWRGGWCR